MPDCHLASELNVVVMSALGGGEDGSQVAETSAGSGAVKSGPAAADDTASEDEPEPDVVEDEPDPEPAMTVAQEQAVQSASSYLDMGGFSRQGLIEQLTSDAEGCLRRRDGLADPRER